jgi:hypothetical protein
MLVFSSVYQLPFGKGKTFLSNPNWLVQTAAGNWNLGTIISHNSGQPFNALIGTDLANTGGPNQRPDRVPGANVYTGLKSNLNGKQWLNTSALPLPATYTYGNEGRDDLVGPGYTDVDLSAYKDFPIKEKFTMQFRGEFFNLFNHTNYSLPNTTVQSSTFGLITTAAGQGRQVQFALKAIF